LSYVDCHPGLSENKLCEGLLASSTIKRATAQRLLKKAVENGWLVMSKTPSGNRYEVTEKGRKELDRCPL